LLWKSNRRRGPELDERRVCEDHHVASLGSDAVSRTSYWDIMAHHESLRGADLPDAKDFYVYLKEAQATDLSDIERTGCIGAGRDLKGNPVIVLIPTLGTTPGEKMETSFRKMLLLFIRRAHDIVGSSYAVVYAHTNVDIINQYPLIYKFYSVLPREFKKNLTKMYVIHPNVALKMFFEFARVFLSHKFYSKLVLLDSILEFQRLIPPTQLLLPLRFLRKEDEIRGLKFHERMASLRHSFDPSVGAPKAMHMCATFIKANGGLQQKGIFRIAGDAGDINLVRVRLQYAFQHGDFTERMMLSENHDYILVGNMDGLQKNRPMTLDRKTSGDLSVKSKPGAESSPSDHSPVLPEELPMSVVVINEVHTVARMFTMPISHLPEPLVPFELYCSLIELTRKHEVPVCTRRCVFVHFPLHGALVGHPIVARMRCCWHVTFFTRSLDAFLSCKHVLTES
jgi:hypothetical protein